MTRKIGETTGEGAWMPYPGMMIRVRCIGAPPGQFQWAEYGEVTRPDKNYRRDVDQHGWPVWVEEPVETESIRAE